ncbi:DNA polymerase epsilon subunit 2 [Adelges cooleyi]|uniref:DNA polymerase epsilon subunit 2 n=1 Tax=Adelges cooleyi TaxID=133065 RepID=UPI002180238B|nr:DNA polymerase epsilon subunit 2 [Adelges cooleyi]
MTDQSVKLRKRVISTFSLNGFTIEERACAYLVSQLEPLPNDRERDAWLDKIVDYIQSSSHNNTSTLVDFELLVKALKFCCDSEVLNANDTLSVKDCIQQYNYRYRYCPVKKKFFKESTNDGSQLSLFGDARAKIRQFVDRYTIVKQQMFRVHAATANTSSKDNGGSQTIGDRLRDVDYLLSSGGAVKGRSMKSSSSLENIILLGIITQLKEGRYYIEDPTGAIQLDLTDTDFHKGYFTENCCVLAEGVYDEINCVFKVADMALPPGESAEISRIYFGDCSDEIFTKSNSTTLKAYEEKNKRMIIFVSDIHLDNMKVLGKFKTLLRGFNDHSPAAIVMTGDYLSASSVPGSQYAIQLQQHFTELAEWITANCPRICRDTTFVILPGPNDRHCANILPKLALPEFLTQRFSQLLPKTVFTTNPTHMRYCTQRMCIVRADLITKTLRNALNIKLQKKSASVDTSIENVATNYVKTLKSQSHLVSLPADVCPVYWTRAQSLSLYPMPDLVCVADSDAPPFCVNNDDNSQRSSPGCVYINPSSFSKRQYTFIVYMTAERRADESQIPPDSVDTDMELQ